MFVVRYGVSAAHREPFLCTDTDLESSTSVSAPYRITCRSATVFTFGTVLGLTCFIALLVTKLHERFRDLAANQVLQLLDKQTSTRLTVVSIVVNTNPDFEEKIRLLQGRLEERGFQHRLIRFSGQFSMPALFAERMRRYHAAALEAKEDDVLLLLDALDVIALGTADRVMQLYNELGQDIVVGCQFYQWPRGPNDEVICPAFEPPLPCIEASRWGCETPKVVKYAGKMQPCGFACGGTILARAGALRRLYSENPWPYEKDDQCYLNERLRQGWPNMTLDNGQTIFMNSVGQLGMSPQEVLQLRPLPMFIHFDGSHPTLETLHIFLEATRGSGKH